LELTCEWKELFFLSLTAAFVGGVLLVETSVSLIGSKMPMLLGDRMVLKSGISDGLAFGLTLTSTDFWDTVSAAILLDSRILFLVEGGVGAAFVSSMVF